jgi:hypothetical protein
MDLISGVEAYQKLQAMKEKELTRPQCDKAAERAAERARGGQDKEERSR